MSKRRRLARRFSARTKFAVVRWLNDEGIAALQAAAADMPTVLASIKSKFGLDFDRETFERLCADAEVAPFWRDVRHEPPCSPGSIGSVLARCMAQLYEQLGEPVPPELRAILPKGIA